MNIMNNYSLQTLSLLTAVLTSSLIAVDARSSLAAIMFTGEYSQNFDSLQKTPENSLSPWGNNATIEGWYSNRENYLVNKGTGVTASLYSFGQPNDGDRALGSVASGSTGEIRYGAEFTNAIAGKAINELEIKYTGEQWRNASTNKQKLLFEFGATATSLGSNSYTSIAQLDFTSPQNLAGNTDLNGNAAANRTALSFTIKNLNLAPDAVFWVRWRDPDDTGADHGLAIDDFSIKAVKTTAVPEPLTIIGSSVAIGFGAFFKRNLSSVR